MQVSSNMQVTLYHNPRCSKSREALALLQEKGITPQIIRYLDTPLSAVEITELLKKLAVPVRQLLRNNEPEYATLGLTDPALSEEALVQAIVDHPKLMERPIAVVEQRAVIGRPPEAILALL